MHWLCYLWWLLAGTLLGWLLNRWLIRRPDRIVQKIVDRPVEVIKTVEKIVEKQFDNPIHLGRIQSLESEVAMIAGLRATIGKLEATPPKIIEKIVDRPVDRIIEKIVDRPVDRIVDRPIDRIVEKLVDNPAHLARISALEIEIQGLRARTVRVNRALAKQHGFEISSMDDLEIIEGIGPKIRELLNNNGIYTFLELSETPVDRLRQILDTGGGNFRISNPGTWPEQATLAARNIWGELRRLQDDELTAGVRIDRSQEEAALKLASLDKAAVSAAGMNVKGMDDLEVIEGIGPKICELFHKAGIMTFYELSQTPVARMKEILEAGGPNFRLADPGTWARQSGLAARNKWEQLKKLQDELTAGINKKG